MYVYRVGKLYTHMNVQLADYSVHRTYTTRMHAVVFILAVISVEVQCHLSCICWLRAVRSLLPRYRFVAQFRFIYMVALKQLRR